MANVMVASVEIHRNMADGAPTAVTNKVPMDGPFVRLYGQGIVPGCLDQTKHTLGRLTH